MLEVQQAKDLNGNRVAEVFVSQASKDMAANRTASPEAIDEWAKINDEISALSSEQRGLEVQMIALNSKVKGQRLDPMEYRRLCDSQIRIRERMTEISNRRGVLKPRFTELKCLMHAWQAGSDGQGTAEQTLQVLREIRDILRAFAQK